MAGSDKRKAAEKWGRMAEDEAVAHLETGGYTILDRRARTGVGELDIVARRGDEVAFVEVKARRRFEDGLVAVAPRQAARIAAAAQQWLAGREGLENVTCRFDIILVKPGHGLHHLENAFGESGSPI